jgi:hypothetical protein
MAHRPTRSLLADPPPCLRAGRRRAALALPLAIALAGCTGLDAGVDYPDESGDWERHLIGPENDADPSVSFGEFKIHPDACKGIPTQPVVQPLTPDDLARFLDSQGAKIQPRRARTNLYWFDFPNGDGGFVRLRLAVLSDTNAAAKDLHASLLEHGPGWWGVRRSNLAVLAPKAGLSEALGFAMKHKLVCWGVFTYAGVDDAYVVPGPYAQL